ncbi:MAG: shikimate dehydrogenase [Saprospiraceae bacterium]|nr:shikimate dehydrogenase [Saprospiraceae bacterium]
MKKRRFGLIGKSLVHSFSPAYFDAKFRKEGISDARYEAYELAHIVEINKLFEDQIDGLNVTLPYKEAVIPYLDKMDPAALEIGAVNCISREGSGYTGYNTDWLGFLLSLKSLLGDERPSALVLGDGGASKAIGYALTMLNINYEVISRKLRGKSYQQLTESDISNNRLIINATSLGMFPHTDEKPEIPYEGIHDEHFLFDVVYNPEKTLFLTLGAKQGAHIQNGYEMLVLQAEESWKIWNRKI